MESQSVIKCAISDSPCILEFTIFSEMQKITLSDGKEIQNWWCNVERYLFWNTAYKN